LAEVLHWSAPNSETLRVVTRWASHITPLEAKQEAFQEAIRVVDRAIAATILHSKERKSKLKPTLSPVEISELWREASYVVGPLDPGVADAMGMKGLGWIDEDAWKRAEKRGLDTSIGAMEEAIAKLRRSLKDTADNNIPAWFPKAGVGFLALTIVFLMYLLVGGPPIDQNKRIVFDALMAMGMAGSATFLGGSVIAKGQIPFFKNAPVHFSAAGGVAVFIIVFLLFRNAGATEEVVPTPSPLAARNYRVCISEYASTCGRYDVYLSCGHTISEWVKTTCRRANPVPVSRMEGRRCESLVYEVFCERRLQ
jgi:hypothetical protein